VPRRKASDDGRDEDRIGFADCRVDDPADALGRGRLDPLALAVPEQHRPDVFDAPLVLSDVRRQPSGELLGIADAADPKPGVVADLAAMVLDLPAGEVVGADLRRGDVDLSREVLDRAVGQLEQAARKAALPDQELQHPGEPQAC